MTTHDVPATILAYRELAALARGQGWTADDGLKLALAYLERQGRLVDFLGHCRAAVPPPPKADKPPPPPGGLAALVGSLRERSKRVRPADRDAARRLRGLAYAMRWRSPKTVYRYYQTMGPVREHLPAAVRAYLGELFRPFTQKADDPCRADSATSSPTPAPSR